MSEPIKDEVDKAKYVRDYQEGRETAEADLEGDGPNTSLIGGLVGKVRDMVDPSPGREDGYQDEIESEKGGNDA
jgi:hypothetical protein